MTLLEKFQPKGVPAPERFGAKPFVIRAAHAVDFYKTGHAMMYPEGTDFVYSNSTPRSDKFANLGPGFDHKVVWVGLQGVLQWLLLDTWNRTFFDLPRETAVSTYLDRVNTALGGNRVSGEQLRALHDLGYLPIRIKALPEGSRLNLRVPYLTIRNTRRGFGWLTNYLETMLSAETWKTITTATIAYEYRRLLTAYAVATGSPLPFVNWQGHDFSMRGMPGLHDAARSGIGHLLSFLGTDTVPALDYIEDFYPEENPAAPEAFLGGSVPATEHSVMCMGLREGERETYRRLICDLFPEGVISIVSDTWDLWNVITGIIPSLKAEILARKPDANGLAKVVLRPDSGDPVKILAGDPDAEPGSPAFKGAVELLWEVFGGTITETGHRLLDSHIGLIYGDSITFDRASRILEALKVKGFASGNVVLGIGSFTYQSVTRDTFGQAIKATYGVVNGVGRDLEKDPITDSGTKRSAKGLLRVEEIGDDFVLFEQQTEEEEERGALRDVFVDGKLFNMESFSTIRQRLHRGGFFG